MKYRRTIDYAFYDSENNYLIVEYYSNIFYILTKRFKFERREYDGAPYYIFDFYFFTWTFGKRSYWE